MLEATIPGLDSWGSRDKETPLRRVFYNRAFHSPYRFASFLLGKVNLAGSAVFKHLSKIMALTDFHDDTGLPAALSIAIAHNLIDHAKTLKGKNYPPN